MTKRRKILILLAGLVLAVGVYMLFIRESEPTYKGRKLSEWVVVLIHDSGSHIQIDAEAAEAIRQMGGRAVPFLVKWVSYSAPPWREHLDDFCDQHRRPKWLGSRDLAKHARTTGASEAFAFVGPEARKAIPDLRQLLHSEDIWVRTAAASALLKIAPEALTNAPAQPR